MSDEDIIREILENNFSNFDVLYYRYRDNVYAVAYQILKDRFYTENCVQNVFYKVSTKISQLQTESKFPAWLRRVTCNEALSILRSLRRRHRNELLLIEGIDFPDKVDSRININQLASEVSDVVDSINNKDVEVFRLRVLREMSLEEIAQHLSISVAATRARLYRGRHAVIKLLDCDSKTTFISSSPVSFWI